ncbi:hypothetical protein [Mesorhizobium escarrei]|uniref:Uncharacterized protein n=1 Tax=Mesorhizobium escarrei TaxID=666018 RepID=A0ABM9EDN5_9HYPH|nr:hypothetical protein [Mesorhizobium escarrei]CAH2407437.1 conserved hypothetical protein [Mesorhizobium escarrei]
MVSGNSGAWARAAPADSIAAAKGSANLLNPANLIDVANLITVGGVSTAIRR